MTSEECIAKALLEPGFRIRRPGWITKGFIQLSGNLWVDEDEVDYEYQVHPKYAWEPFIEPVKMVTWYRPNVVWHKDQGCPLSQIANEFFRDKNLHHWRPRSVKVIEWEEIQAPETWEQVK